MDIKQAPGFENMDDEEAEAINDLLRDEVYREKVLVFNPDKKKIIDKIYAYGTLIFREANVKIDVYTYQNPLTPCDVEIEFDILNNNAWINADNTKYLSDMVSISDGFFIETTSNGEGIKITFRVRYAYVEIIDDES